MTISKYLDPKVDIAFKKIFGKENNKDILVDFINSILELRGNDTIISVDFIPTNNIPDHEKNKLSHVDVRCTDQRGDTYIVEMQVAPDNNFDKRVLYYFANTYGDQLKSGRDYSNLRKVVFILITSNFMLAPDNKDLICDIVIQDKKTKIQYFKDFSCKVMELKKFHNDDISTLSNIIEKWAYFFKYPHKTDEKAVKKYFKNQPSISKAYNELDEYGWNEEERRTYFDDSLRNMTHANMLDTQYSKGVKKGREEGEKKGIDIGEKKKAIKIAKSLVSQNISLDIIQKATGLPLREIEFLIDN